jgi:16S rRNA (guanine527-N7)-methyltransferase
MASDISVVQSYFPALTSLQINQLETYGQLLCDWNLRINLISRKDIAYVYLHHILYSLAPAKYISFLTGQMVLDVGTGGGLPGIPLAILFPDTHFHLIDRTQKKIVAVKEMVRSLAIANVTAEQITAEELHTKFHIILGRGVTNLDLFIHKVKHLIKVDRENQYACGILYLKGGDIEPEVRHLTCPVKIIPVSDYYSEPYFETKKIVHCPSGKWINAK